MKTKYSYVWITCITLAVVGLAGCSAHNKGTKQTAVQQQTTSQVEAENAVSVTEALTEKETPKAVLTKVPQVMETAKVTPSEQSKTIEIPKFSVKKFDYKKNTALKFVEKMKVGWNLGNTMDAYAEINLANDLACESYWCGAVTTKEMITKVKEAGFRTIRIPVSWHNHVSGKNYKINAKWLNRVQEIVDYAMEEDMYIILNIHHDIDMDFYYPDKTHYDNSAHYVKCIWKQVAARFKDYDEHLIFETINEPRLKDTAYEWGLDLKNEQCKEAVDCVNKLNQLSLDTIRAAGGKNKKRYIMVPGYCASPDYEITDLFKLPKDIKGTKNRLIVSTHAYTPYNFALKPLEESGSTKEFSIKQRKGTNDIDYFMDRLYQKYIKNGIPVIIGEFGARDKEGNLQQRTEYTAYYIKSARARGITCVWWDNHSFSGNGENFGIFDRKQLDWPYPEIVKALMDYSK